MQTEKIYDYIMSQRGDLTTTDSGSFFFKRERSLYAVVDRCAIYKVGDIFQGTFEKVPPILDWQALPQPTQDGIKQYLEEGIVGTPFVSTLYVEVGFRMEPRVFLYSDETHKGTLVTRRYLALAISSSEQDIRIVEQHHWLPPHVVVTNANANPIAWIIARDLTLI